MQGQPCANNEIHFICKSCIENDQYMYFYDMLIEIVKIIHTDSAPSLLVNSLYKSSPYFSLLCQHSF